MTNLAALLKAPETAEHAASFLRDLDTSSTPGFDGDKAAALAQTQALLPELTTLQGQLFAQGYVGGSQRLLLVIQGMDTSGKGGVLKTCVGAFDPGGVRVTSFKKPTAEELSHDFLWRIRRALPEPGYVGIFDRSHYEDVLIARVRELAPRDEVERRYTAINEFEAELAGSGVTVLKCMLAISPQEQQQRLLDRLEDPSKQWKYKPGDVDERSLWGAYQEAYAQALGRCQEAADWHVIPADRKWYRTWAISQLLHDALTGMDLEWPKPGYDVTEELKRVKDSVL